MKEPAAQPAGGKTEGRVSPAFMALLEKYGASAGLLAKLWAGPKQTRRICWQCRGSGNHKGKTCDVCGGSGYA